jgi:hypothetical protein
MNPVLISPQASKHRRLQAPNSLMDKPQPDNPENQFHHIVRHDVETDGINDWRVRVIRNKIVKSKRFSDEKYGGRDEALQAAIRYRNEFLEKTDHFVHQMWVRTIVQRNNTTGIPGVARKERVNRRYPNTRYVFWFAKWTDEFGVRRQRAFSVSLYGELAAKQLAIAERDLQIKRVCATKASHRRDPPFTKKKNPKPQHPAANTNVRAGHQFQGSRKE